MKLLSTLTLVAVVLGIGCSNKAAEKSAQSAPTAPVAAKPVDPPKPSLATAADDQIEGAAAEIIAANKRALAYTSPTGDAISLDVLESGKRNITMTLVANEHTVLTTIDTGIERGDRHSYPLGAVGRASDGTILFVAGADKTNSKAQTSYEAHVYTWDSSTKRLLDARKVSWVDAYDPQTDEVP